MNILRAIGLSKPTAPSQEIADYALDLKRANQARDNWRDSSKEWEAKFKRAVKDLTSQADEIAALSEELAAMAAEIAALRPDAQKWRDRAARELQRGQAKRGKGK